MIRKSAYFLLSFRLVEGGQGDLGSRDFPVCASYWSVADDALLSCWSHTDRNNPTQLSARQ
jgi:hypothetical protein